MTQVTERALVARINRKLAHDREQMHRTRGERWRGDLGDYYITETRTRALIAARCTPEGVGREIGVLRHGETVIE
jgi:hypothetical protein